MKSFKRKLARQIHLYDVSSGDLAELDIVNMQDEDLLKILEGAVKELNNNEENISKYIQQVADNTIDAINKND